jgi:manganese/zinc/iron transport system permease protein
LAIFSLFYKEFLLTTFDPGLARGLGFSCGFYNYLLMGLASLTVVSAFRAVGVLMVLAMITAPPMTARLLANDVRSMQGYSALFGVVASIVGVALSRHLYTVYGLALSTGGIVVCILIILYAAAVIAKNIIWRGGRRTASG